jgi:hypothetical protein
MCVSVTCKCPFMFFLKVISFHIFTENKSELCGKAGVILLDGLR